MAGPETLNVSRIGEMPHEERGFLLEGANHEDKKLMHVPPASPSEWCDASSSWKTLCIAKSSLQGTSSMWMRPSLVWKVNKQCVMICMTFSLYGLPSHNTMCVFWRCLITVVIVPSWFCRGKITILNGYNIIRTKSSYLLSSLFFSLDSLFLGGSFNYFPPLQSNICYDSHFTQHLIWFFPFSFN